MMRFVIVFAVVLFGMACSRSPQHLSPSAQTLHQIGAFDQGNGILRSQKGEAGALMFGPYVQLAPGEYEVSFHVKAMGTADAVVGRVDVNGVDDKNPDPDSIATMSVVRSGSGEQVVRLNFRARPEILYEFRVWANGLGSMEVRDVSLRRT